MLGVIIKCDSKIVNYVDVSLNLNVGIYKAYKKPNKETGHIHVDSNYPPSVMKKIPKSMAARLFSLSSSKEKLLEAAQPYKQNLISCGRKKKLTYVEKSVKKQKETRKINIKWFNPPESKTLKKSSGKCFSRLTKKHFIPEHKFHKIFKRNTLKLATLACQI